MGRVCLRTEVVALIGKYYFKKNKHDLMTNVRVQGGRDEKDRSFETGEVLKSMIHQVLACVTDTENVTVSIKVDFQLGFPEFFLSRLLGIRIIGSYKNHVTHGS